MIHFCTIDTATAATEAICRSRYRHDRDTCPALQGKAVIIVRRICGQATQSIPHVFIDSLMLIVLINSRRTNADARNTVEEEEEEDEETKALTAHVPWGQSPFYETPCPVISFASVCRRILARDVVKHKSLGGETSLHGPRDERNPTSNRHGRRSAYLASARRPESL